jgi:hypothetical protein
MIMSNSPDFWAMADKDLLDRWPKGADGKPEEAVKLVLQSELDGMADITLSMLAGFGIPAFKVGTQGKVIFGFAGLGVEIYVPASRLEEANELLAAEAEEISEEEEQ